MKEEEISRDILIVREVKGVDKEMDNSHLCPDHPVLAFASLRQEGKKDPEYHDCFYV